MAGDNHCAHIIRLGSHRLTGLVPRAFGGSIHDTTCYGSTRSLPEQLLQLLVGEVIVDAIGAKEKAISWANSGFLDVDAGYDPVTQCLSDTISLLEIHSFGPAELPRLGCLVDVSGALFGQQVSIDELGEQAVVVSQASQRLLGRQQIYPAVSYPGIDD